MTRLEAYLGFQRTELDFSGQWDADDASEEGHSLIDYIGKVRGRETPA